MASAELNGGREPRVVGQSQVIVGAEIQQRAAVADDSAQLRTAADGRSAPQLFGLQSCQFVVKPIERMERHARRSHAEPDEHNVVVLNDVVFLFLPQEVLGLDFAFAAQPNQIGTVHRFGADESTREVAVDGVRRLQGGERLAGSARSGLPFRWR